MFREIPPDEVPLIDKKLGQGKFGYVYKGQSKGTIVAVKRPVSENEVDIHSRLRNDNIVQFFGAYNYSNSYAIVMEYAENGCLYGYLKQHPVSDSELTGQTLRWAEDIASGLNYLHNKICVIHLDLKSPNVVLDRNYTAKICDFGCSRFYSQFDTEPISFIGTLPWMSPEMIRSQPVSESADVFSFGVVLWELVTHESPWKEQNKYYIMYHVGKGSRLVIPPMCPVPFAKLIQRCWEEDPKQRITCKDILRDLEKMKEKVSQPVEEKSQTMQSHLVVSTRRLPPQLYRQSWKHSAARTHPEAIDHRLPRDNSSGPQELNEPRPFCEPNDVPEMTEQDGHSLEQTNHDPSTTTQIVTMPTAVNDDDVQQCVEEQGTQVKAHTTDNTVQFNTDNTVPQHRYCPSYSI